MKTKHIPLAAVAAALLLAGAAHAQQRPMQRSQTPVYGELGYTFFEVKDDSGPGFKANPQAIRAILGYDFHPYFAVEGMAAFGTSDDSDKGVSVKLRNAYGIFAKPKFDFDKFQIFARLGWEHHRTRARALNVTVNDSDSGFAWGVGANYNFNPRTYVSVDYMKLRDQDSTKVQGWTVGVGYRF